MKNKFFSGFFAIGVFASVLAVSPMLRAESTTPATTTAASEISETTTVASSKPTVPALVIVPTPVGTEQALTSEIPTTTVSSQTNSSLTSETSATEAEASSSLAPSSSPDPSVSPTPTPTPTPTPVDASLTGLSSKGRVSVASRWVGARLVAPLKTDPKYGSDNAFSKMNAAMPNCTAYVYGRAWEILGKRPNLSGSHANTFWGYNYRNGSYAFGQEPRVGAIACWNDGEFGHVAIVEAVKGNQIQISESFWQGSYFQTRWIPHNTEGFQGYIYLADFDERRFAKEEKNKVFVGRLLTSDGKKALTALGKQAVLQPAEQKNAGQFWRFTLGEEGYYEIRNANGFVLDVAGAMDKDAVHIQLDDLTSSEGQRWTLLADQAFLALRPKYTRRLLAQVNENQLEIYSEPLPGEPMKEETPERQFRFKLERFEAPDLTVLSPAKGQVVDFSIALEPNTYSENYLRLYRGESGQSSPIILTFDEKGHLRQSLDPGYYEVCVESGAGQALSSSAIRSFTVENVSPKKINVEHRLTQ